MKKNLNLAASLLAMVSMLASNVAFATVTPDIVDQSLAVGTSTNVDKTVTTPAIPPNPDVVFLADTTGSMGPTLANVQANAAGIMSDILAAQPTAQFGVAQYRDIGDVPLFSIDQSVTANTTDVQNKINAWAAGGGGDTPEAQINALFELGDDVASVGYRTGSTRIVVWFGDASGHDPSNGHTQADAIAALNAAGVKVIAVPVVSGFGDGLDLTGQATAVTTATGGVLVPSAAPDDVSAAILAGLGNLPVTVSWDASSCAPNLNVSLAPASQVVTSGSDALFVETIGVPNDPSLMGTTQSCTVHFMDEHGNSLGDEKITIRIPDTVAPAASCTETVNPAGKNVPTAHKTNEDGYFVLGGKDNLLGVQVFLKDSVTGTVFGPFAPDTKVKYIEANGAKPSQKPGSGVVSWKINGQGDAIVYATDAAGNTSKSVSCLVPPSPK